MNIFRWPFLGVCIVTLLPPPAQGNPKVYKQVAPSTVAIYGQRGNFYGGAGVLVDVKNRLVVTADHVIRRHYDRGNMRVKVMFGQKNNGRMMTDIRYYKRHARRLLIPGKIIVADIMRDVAVIQLDRLPKDAQAVSLAKIGPDPGERVHVIGHSTSRFGGMFGYNTGHVRNSFFWISSSYIRHTLSHHSPTNKGDSGGPIVNDKGELVAIVSTGTIGEPSKPGQWTFQLQVVDHSAHVKEIRHVIEKINDLKLSPPSAKLLHMTASAPLGIPKRMVDHFLMPVKRGQKVEVNLKGDGGSNLDLYIADQNGKVLVKKSGNSDKESAAFVPTWSGLAKIRVLNFKGRKDRYTLTMKWANMVTGPMIVIRRIDKQTTDRLEFHYRAGQKARLSLLGDGDANLDIVVLDPAGNEVARTKGPSDQEEVSFTVKMAGVHTVEIVNRGKIWNQYVLTTD